ncbi:chitin synthase [Elysia marginata]|uniref:Chitin synthase n=1 Tax=Elysia marginata TaxID=1093978 RepID=A0AAV4HAE3_9GAST|nr:chitin synthase [Elysia marginata]
MLLNSFQITSQHEGKKSAQLPPCRRAISVVLSGVLAVYPLLTTGLVGLILCLWSSFEFSPAQCAVATISMFLLSTIWHPEVISLTFMSCDGKNRCSRVQMIYAIVKTAATAVALFISMAFKVGLFRKYPYEHLVFAFQESAQFGVFAPLVICCFGGLFSFLLCVAASKVCLTTPVLQISMFLSPILAIVVSAVLWNDFETGAFWEVSAADYVSWVAIVLSACAWLIPQLLNSFQRLNNAKVANRKLQDSFYSFSWSPFFLEPRIVMNYEKDFIVKRPYSYRNLHSEESKNSEGKPKFKTVFICTTMYKENETEMSRYARSIKSTFEYDWEKQNTKLEAHVIFDSSVSSNEISRRGRHFLGLLCATFGLEYSDLIKFSTAYGCQVQIPELVKGHTMFVHFKDATKVKAKKRWSQVMYMHYILNVRAQQNGNYQVESRHRHNKISRNNQNIYNTFATSDYLSKDFPTDTVTGKCCHETQSR